MNMKKTELSALGINVPLGLFDYYLDAGFVKNNGELASLISQKYNIPSDLVVKAVDKDMKIGSESHWGLSGYVFKKGRIFTKRFFYVGYEDSNSEPDNLFRRGHEESHILQILDKEKLLEEKIGIILPKEIDVEIRANIGGIHALQRQGFSSEDMEDQDYLKLTEAIDFYRKKCN